MGLPFFVQTILTHYYFGSFLAFVRRAVVNYKPLSILQLNQNSIVVKGSKGPGRKSVHQNASSHYMKVLDHLLFFFGDLLVLFVKWLLVFLGRLDSFHDRGFRWVLSTKLLN